MNRTLILRKQTLITAALVILTASGFSSAQTTITNSLGVADSALPRLEREIARLAKGAGGVVGVSAVHLQSNRRVALNGSARFPMASTYKVPIAVQLLTRVDKGEVRLDQMIQLQPGDLHPGSGTLTDLFDKDPLTLDMFSSSQLLLSSGSASKFQLLN